MVNSNIGDNKTSNCHLAWKEKVKKLPIEIFIKCKTQQKIDSANSDAARKFFQENFHTYAIRGESGLLTAYYEPVLRGSRKETKKYYSPIFKRPSNLPSVSEVTNRVPRIQKQRVGDKTISYS